jgi:hypothetical protein
LVPAPEAEAIPEPVIGLRLARTPLAGRDEFLPFADRLC